LLKLKKDKSEAEISEGAKIRASSADGTGPKKKLVLRRVAYRPPGKDKQPVEDP
jgi:hypothetical protein|tara:strand:- start:576 stop:737 length:162 start_codon:yes stop_codon:yes gene_type:complete